MGGLLIEPALIWLIALIFLVVLEAATMRLIAVWFALGALCGLLTSLFSDSAPVQLTVFAIMSALSLLIARPHKKRRREGRVPDRVVGCQALVLERIDNAAEAGSVSILGRVFNARSEEGVTIDAGVKAIVTRMEGVKVFVREIKGG